MGRNFYDFDYGKYVEYMVPDWLVFPRPTDHRLRLRLMVRPYNASPVWLARCTCRNSKKVHDRYMYGSVEWVARLLVIPQLSVTNGVPV